MIYASRFTLFEALRHVSGIVGTEADAKASIIRALEYGDMTARCEELASNYNGRTQGETILEKSFWGSADVDWKNSSAKGIWKPHSSKLSVTAKRISVGYKALSALFKAKEMATGTRKSTGGRPPKHDWEGALIEAAVWIKRHDVPENAAELTKHLLTWFGEDAPAESQVRERVSRLVRRFKAPPKT